MYAGTSSNCERKIQRAGLNMDSLLIGFQIAVSLVLIVVVLLQVKGQGAALFGSAESSFRTRRGLEKILFQFTIGLIVVFIGISILSASSRIF